MEKPPTYQKSPFVPLSRRLNEEFQKLLIELLYLIREYGISQIKPDHKNPDELFKFVVLVHDGWKKAQNIIAVELLKRLDIHDGLLKKRKKQHSNRDEAIDTKILLHNNKFEIIVLRRMLDSIAWQILKGEHSTVRRLQVKDAESNLSKKSIEDSLPTANLWNKDPQTIAICTDMTTFVHIGDLLVSKHGEETIVFVELKSGKKNLFFVDAAKFSIESKSTEFDSLFKESLDERDVKHYERNKRQLLRGIGITDTINKEEGHDVKLDKKIKIHPTEIPIMKYSDAIVKCCNEINDKKTWAIETIDDCLHIGVYSNSAQGYVAFNGWMDIIKCKSSIYNLTDSFYNGTATPFANLDLPTETLEKIIKGDILIVLCLDVRALIDVANEIKPNFLQLKRSKKLKTDSQKMDFMTLDGQYVTTDEGGAVGAGLIDRIIFDLQHPLNALEMLYRMTRSSAR